MNRFSSITLLTALLLWGGSLSAQVTFIKHPVDENFDGAWAAYGVDLDRDNDMDILASALDGNDIAWYENDGHQNFTKHLIDGNFALASYLSVIDLDEDEDLGFFAGSEYTNNVSGDLAWFENDGSQNFTKHVIDSNRSGANSVFAIDLDGDADIDVVSDEIETDDLLWYENDGSQNFTKHLIDGNYNNVFYVYAIDLDQDNDADVLAAATDAGELAWWENDGSENFTKHLIVAGFSGSTYVDVKDVDGDTDWDVMGAAFFNNPSGNEVAWFENDGSQNFARHTIDDNFTGANSFDAVDLDGDGDRDFIGVAFFANDVAWWENDGNLNFTKHLIDDNFTQANLATIADIDGDGDVDIIGAAYAADNVVWWENTLITGIAGANNLLPGDFRLLQNYPNPFNPSTTIRFSLAKTTQVKLTVYNTLGQQVAVLANDNFKAGDHEVVWSPAGLPGGVFYCRLQAGSFVEARKMILLK